MIRHNNENGSVNVSTGVYTDIAGNVASSCFGVKGMAARSVKDGVYHLLRKESVGKGVHVEFHEDDTIIIRFRCEDEFGLGYDFLFFTWTAEGEIFEEPDMTLFWPE